MRRLYKPLTAIVLVSLLFLMGSLAVTQIMGLGLAQGIHESFGGSEDVSTWGKAYSLYQAMKFEPSSIGHTEITDDELGFLLRQFPGGSESDVWVRKFCVFLLGEVGSHQAQGFLIDSLNDDNQEVVSTAIASLGKCGDYEAVEPLMSSLEEGSKQDAITTLLATDDPRARELFVQGLENNNTTVRTVSALWLGQSGDQQAACHLVEALGKEHGQAFQAGGFGKADRVEALFDVEYAEMSPVQAEAIAIAQINDPDSIGQLIDIAVSGASVASRQGAIGSLALAREPRAVETLVKVLNDPYTSADVQKTAALGLGNFSTPEVNEALCSALSSAEPSVALHAALSLANIGHPPTDYTPVLLSWLQKVDAPGELRATAATVLGQMKEKNAVEPLVDILENPGAESASSDLQEAAICSLGKIGDERALDCLSSFLSNGGTDKVREAAIVSLGNLDTSQSFSPLESFLQNAGHTLRQNWLAISSLKKIDPLRSGQVLADLMPRSNDMPFKQAAVLGLADLDEPIATESLLTSLNDDCPEVRYAALGSLTSKVSQPEVKQSFIDLLKYDNDPFVRSQAALGLEGIEDIQVTGALKLALDDPYPQVRKAAILSVTPLADLDTMQRIKPFISDTNLGIRQTAILSLGLRANDFPQNIDYLTPGLDDMNWQIRQTTITALGANINEFPQLKQPFLSIIEDDLQPFSFRQNAMLSLSKIDEPEVRSLLIDNLNNSDWRMRQTATIGLGGFKDPDLMTSLKPLTQDSYWQVRQATAASLANFDSPLAAEPLKQLLQDPYWQVRSTAVSSLSALEVPAKVTALTPLLKDSNCLVRQATAQALGTDTGMYSRPQTLWTDSSQGIVNQMLSDMKAQQRNKIEAQYMNTLMTRDFATVANYHTQVGALVLDPTYIGLRLGVAGLSATLLEDSVSRTPLAGIVPRTAQPISRGISDFITGMSIGYGIRQGDTMGVGLSALSYHFGNLAADAFDRANQPFSFTNYCTFDTYDGYTRMCGQALVETTSIRPQSWLFQVPDVFEGTTITHTMASWRVEQGAGLTYTNQLGSTLSQWSSSFNRNSLSSNLWSNRLSQSSPSLSQWSSPLNTTSLSLNRWNGYSSPSLPSQRWP